MSSMKARVKAWPVVRAWVARRWQSTFLTAAGYGGHYGVYASFDEARQAIPPSPEFDQRALTDEYVTLRSRRVFPYDYPVMFWLRQALESAGANAAVTDIGGSVGVHFYAYRKYLAYPPGLRWLVHETPEVARVGAEMAAKEGVEASLRFQGGSALPALDGDIWLACGAIQYIDDARPGTLLERAAVRPRHLIINKMPLYAGDDFVSTQNIGAGSYAPVHIFNRARYIDEIKRWGYRLVDAWEVPERQFVLPAEPERSFGSFSGMCFERL